METRREFGAVGPEGTDLLGGLALDENDWRGIQLRRFRQQAVRGARETDYYSELFRRLDLNPAHLTEADIVGLPLTPKTALRDSSDAFVRRSVRPSLRTTTTGTTGPPTAVYFSTYELRASVALAAIRLLFDGSITAEDVVQLSTSSRATLGNFCFANACARVGALVCPVGLVSPELTLGLLSETRRLPGKRPKVSILCTYPSYLGALVERGLALGYGPSDFGLRLIEVGGEIVTAGLKARAQRLFGSVAFGEGYAMTETWGLGAMRCPAGHLHFEPSCGRLEVLDPETGAPARPGEVGTLVGTPFAPYRDATVVLRYDTEDLVPVVGGPLACPQRHLPATGDLLGKRRLAVRHANGWTTPRDVLEPLEGLDDVPLPARCGFTAVPGGVAVEVVVRQQTSTVRRAVANSLEERNVPLRELRLVDDPGELRHSLHYAEIYARPRSPSRRRSVDR